MMKKYLFFLLIIGAFLVLSCKTSYTHSQHNKCGSTTSQIACMKSDKTITNCGKCEKCDKSQDCKIQCASCPHGQVVN